MRVLMTTASDKAGTTVAAALQQAGHEVLRCHEPDDVVFPCRGITDECPLEAAPVDVALAVRARGDTQPTTREDGISCAIRHRVPLVVAGNTTLQPFREWATAVVGASDPAVVVAACHEAAGARLAGHEACAMDMARQVLDALHVSGEPAVTVTRQHGGLHVEILLDGRADLPYRSMLGARVVAALRAYDHHAHHIDVSLGER